MNFNPQGPRGPRHGPYRNAWTIDGFQSTRPSRASTIVENAGLMGIVISIHKALAGLDLARCKYQAQLDISIHKALAGLDTYCI